MNERCVDCHTEIGWQIERDLGLHGREKAQDCSSCHPDHAGTDFELIHWDEGSADRFDHARAGWPLEGRHAALRCADCHKAEFQRGEVMKRVKRKEPGKSWLGLERACLSCHQDYHLGTLDADCSQCHRLTKWKPATGFDHQRTVFPLDGKHVDVACDKCHLVPGRVFLRAPDGRSIPRYKPVAHEQCVACHEDTHRGQLGNECSRCHTTESFKKIDRQKFDHGRTRFPLRGRHASIECAKCHDPQTAWGKRPAFATCGACHADAHAGQATREGRPEDCAACHDERAFKPSTYTVADHRSSTYPLEGKHASVGCDKCHTKAPPEIPAAELGTARVRLRLKHAACRDCHADDHQGQLAERPDGGACDSCHRVEGWKPSTFDAARHAELELALDGRHREVECSACHGPRREDLGQLPGKDVLGRAGVALTLVASACRECHLDPHARRFEPAGERPKADSCRHCHGAIAFRPSSVTPEQHDRFEYRLEGGHRAVPCALCHDELKEPPSSIRLLRVRGSLRALPFEVDDRRCAACHESPHGRQFDARADGGVCESCHGLDAFRPAPRFDHDRDSAFALDGAHRRVACADCHPAAPGEDGRPITLYRPIPHLCQDCHGKTVPGVVPEGGAR